MSDGEYRAELATTKGLVKELAFYRSLVENKDVTIKHLLTIKQEQREILKQFADMISPAVAQMQEPPNTNQK